MFRGLRILLISAALVSAPAAMAQQGPTGSHMEKAVELFDAGQYRAAQTELTKARAAADDREKIDYMLAQCAAKLGEVDALQKIYNFTESYPGSIYADGLRLSGALCLFDDMDFARAFDEFAAIDPFALRGAERDEYFFKRGYTEFMLSRPREAAASLSQVRPGTYAPHATYYLAYIDYTDGNYSAAKQRFNQLADDASYGKAVPFYILQIEFLEGNYDYVIANGDALMQAAEGPRAAEIARIMAESWFKKEDYDRVMRYMDLYRTNGGHMGPEEYYLTGYSEYMNGNPRQAIAALERVAGPDNKLSQNAAYHMAAAYLELGDKRSAMQSFSIAAAGDYDPTVREDALFNYGKLQFELGGSVFNEAINVLSRYIAEYPGSARVGEATEYLASAYYNSRNYEAAYEAIKGIPNPDNNIRTAFQKISYFRGLDLFNMGRYDDAYLMFEESLQSSFNPKYTALTRFWMGEIAYLRGDYDKAAELYRQYMAVSPATEREYAMSLYNLGYTEFNRNRWDEARGWFDKFLSTYRQQDAYRADVYNRQGDIDFANREFWRAIEMYDNAAKIGTDQRYYSQFQRALMLGYVDRQSRKIESLNDIIRAGVSPYVPDAIYELGQAYITAERFRDAADAMRRFSEAYPTHEKYAAALSDLGLIYQNLGDNDAAINYYKLVVDKAPGSPEAKDAMLALQSIYVGRNDVDSYFALASRSGVETDLGAVQRDSLAYAAAQNVYLRSGNSKASIDALKNYLDRYPRGVYRADALYYTAEASNATGRTADAIDAYRELAGMYYNQYTVRGLEKLAPMLEKEGRREDAAEAYKQLSTVAVNPTTVSGALRGYLQNTAAVGNQTMTEMAADEVEASPAASEEVKREARFLKAGILDQRGESAEALKLYTALATESKTEVGAGATLKVIEAKFAAGDADGARKMILDFAAQNTPHQYELGRAFLILGDIYAAEGDAFQARATLQSIIDGYSPDDDGIVAAAREKISKL